jgi:glycine betaine catabolism B
MKLTFLHKQQEAGDAVSFFFQTPVPINWLAGQYMVYYLSHEQPDERGIKRFFSIATAPYEENIAITTRMSEGKRSSFKDMLSSMKQGQSIEAEGPKGNFVVENPKQQSVFIAGGIGVIPFRSIILDLEHRGLPVNINLLYANKTPEFVYKEEFERITAEYPNFHIHYLVEPDRITKETIKDLVPDLTKPIFFVSGPSPMVDATVEMLESLGVSSDRIKEDHFPGYD